MNDITIKITGKQHIGDKTEERVEFITEGTVSQKNGALYYIYEESEFSGMPGCKTLLKFKDGCLKMKRIGSGMNFGAEMVFDKGKRFTSQYKTPYGVFDMEVLTNKVEAMLDSQGKGTIDIDYHVIFSGMQEGRNALSISIS